jgi:hypothetical protein
MVIVEPTPLSVLLGNCAVLFVHVRPEGQFVVVQLLSGLQFTAADAVAGVRVTFRIEVFRLGDWLAIIEATSFTWMVQVLLFFEQVRPWLLVYRAATSMA